MPYTLSIQSEDKRICAQVAPYNGGMLSQINVDGVDILTIDSGKLESSPMASGGMPILFPFSSKTANDTYVVNEKEFHMPLHGLLKNYAFSVKNHTDNSVVLWAENNEGWLADCYPFKFHLEICYTVTNGSVQIDTSITNNSNEKMPHYFGWHPFFKSTNKSNAFLTQHNTVMFDYVNNKDVEMPKDIPMDMTWDNVFHTMKEHSFSLVNNTDNYKVDCTFDEKFNALTVCTWVDESLCIEPWCGLPNSANINRFINYIQPHSTQEYKMNFKIEKLN